MIDLQISWSWVSLIALGAFHGLNPAMGWLFAVALGFQERTFGAVVRALGPITIGHALSVGVVALAVGALGLVVPQSVLLIGIGLSLIGFAGYKVASRFRHPRWVGMRVRPRDLALWSFLMATAHGAGLMLAPALAGMQGERVAPAGAEAMDHSAHAGHMGHMAADGGDALWSSLAAVAVHSGAMLAVAGAIAVVVYRKVGVEMLRKAWINLDFIWVGALAVTGVITIGFGMWSVVSG